MCVIGIKKVVMMKSDKSEDEQLYCIYSGKRCVHCNRCDVPSYTIINNIPKSNNWDKLIIAMLIIGIIILVMILAPLMMNESSHLIEKSVNNFDSNPIYMQNYESQNQYDGSNIQTYNNDPTTYVSSQLPDGYFVNTTGESYNSMGM